MARLLFLALHSHRFDHKIAVSLRGPLNQQGESPFWEEVSRPIFNTSYQKACKQRVINPSSMASHLPSFPLCIPLLSREAQASIGLLHENTAPAWAVYQQEGFSLTNHIDPLDGGPFVKASLAALRMTDELRPLTFDRPIDSSHLIMSHSLAFDAILLSPQDRAEISSPLSKKRGTAYSWVSLYPDQEGYHE